MGDPPQPAGGEEQRPGRADDPVPEARAEQPAGEGGQPGEQRPGGDHEAGAQHGLVPDAGQEEDAAEHQCAEAAEEGERAQVGQGHRPVPDDGRFEDRVGVAGGAQHETGAGEQGQREGGHDAHTGPAPVRALDDPGHHAGHGDGEEARAEEVGLVGGRVAHLVQEAEPEDEGQHAEGQVDEEHPAPAHLDQQPADGRAEGRRRAPDGRPQADGGPFALRTEGGQQQSERGGQHERAAARLQHPGPDEEAERGSDGAQRRGGGEHGQPEEEGPLAPGPVGPAPGRDEGGREDDRVGAQHPRKRAQALAVVSGRDAGEGDVDDEEVERGQEHAGQDDQGGQRRPGPLRWRGCCRFPPS